MGNKHNEIQVIKIIKNQKLENQDAFLQNVKNCENSSLKKSPKQWHSRCAIHQIKRVRILKKKDTL